jgi:hypothetical protein
MENLTLTPEHQQLRALLAQYRDAETELPALTAATSDGWGAAEWLQKGLAAFWEWLRALLGPSPITLPPGNGAVVLWGLFWVCMVGLVLWLLYALTQRYLRRSRSQATTTGLPPRLDNMPLEQLLATAITEARWDLAARLRWRVFLARMRYQSHLTPQEFFRASPERQRWEQLHGPSVMEQYQMMFSTTVGSPQWYAHYHSRLATLEGQLRHA